MKRKYQPAARGLCAPGRPKVIRFVCLILLIAGTAPRAFPQRGIITTYAGGGHNSRTALSAEITQPQSVAVDSFGNIYIAAPYMEQVFRVDRSGNFTLVAGSGVLGFSGDGGPAASADLDWPCGVALDTHGNLFIVDSGNNRIRRVDAVTGDITTVAGDGSPGFSGDGGLATSASLWSPQGVAVDTHCNLLIADYMNDRVRRVDAKTGDISTIAGDGNWGYSGDGGPATSASLGLPSDVAVDTHGNFFIADTNNFRIRRVDATTGDISTVAGDGTQGFSGDGGPAAGASFLWIWGVAVDTVGNLFIADAGNQRIRRVDVKTGDISTVAGNGEIGFSGDGGPAASASLSSPLGVSVDGLGNILIADTGSNHVRDVAAASQIITTVAGGGSGGDGGEATSATTVGPWAVAVDWRGDLFIADSPEERIRRVDSLTRLITTEAGDGNWGYSGDGGPATGATMNWPEGVALDARGNLFISDAGNARIRRVDALTGIITTVAGDGNWGYSGDGGPATSASLDYPGGVALDRHGNLFIADTESTRIRRVDAVTGDIGTVAGNGNWGYGGDGGPATSAELDYPEGVAVDDNGNLFIADTFNDRIRRVDAKTAIITTIAGNGSWGFSGDGGPATAASLDNPYGVALDTLGNLFIADSNNDRIRRVDHLSGIITTVAGDGNWGFSGDGGLATGAALNYPTGVAVDHFGTLFIADNYNNRVRVVGLPGFFAPLASDLTFASQKLATTSKPQVFTLTNTGTVTLDIESLALGGTDPQDFAWSASGMCQGGVQPGETCSVSVTFTPQKAGSRTATLTIASNAAGSPQTVALNGTGSP